MGLIAIVIAAETVPIIWVVVSTILAALISAGLSYAGVRKATTIEAKSVVIDQRRSDFDMLVQTNKLLVEQNEDFRTRIESLERRVNVSEARGRVDGYNRNLLTRIIQAEIPDKMPKLLEYPVEATI